MSAIQPSGQSPINQPFAAASTFSSLRVVSDSDPLKSFKLGNYRQAVNDLQQVLVELAEKRKANPDICFNQQIFAWSRYGEACARTEWISYKAHDPFVSLSESFNKTLDRVAEFIATSQLQCWLEPQNKLGFMLGVLKGYVDAAAIDRDCNKLSVSDLPEQVLHLTGLSKETDVRSSVIEASEIISRDEFKSYLQQGFHPNESVHSLALVQFAKEALGDKISKDIFDAEFMQNLAQYGIVDEQGLDVWIGNLQAEMQGKLEQVQAKLNPIMHDIAVRVGLSLENSDPEYMRFAPILGDFWCLLERNDLQGYFLQIDAQALAMKIHLNWYDLNSASDILGKPLDWKLLEFQNYYFNQQNIFKVLYAYVSLGVNTSLKSGDSSVPDGLEELLHELAYAADCCDLLDRNNDQITDVVSERTIGENLLIRSLRRVAKESFSNCEKPFVVLGDLYREALHEIAPEVKWLRYKLFARTLVSFLADNKEAFSQLSPQDQSNIREVLDMLYFRQKDINDRDLNTFLPSVDSIITDYYHTRLLYRMNGRDPDPINPYSQEFFSSVINEARMWLIYTNNLEIMDYVLPASLVDRLRFQSRIRKPR